jgi:hypothetical protein
MIIMINIVAACLALKVTFTLSYLVEDILKEMYRRPIRKEELAAAWELLPDGHKIITAAIQSLTYFYRAGKIDTTENTKLEQYIYADPDLEELFDAEESMFKTPSKEKAKATRMMAESESP